MREDEFYNKVVRPNLNKIGDVTRIENTVSSGVPDVSFAAFGREVWIELKVEKAGYLYFESSQLVWMRKRLYCGGRVYAVWLTADGHSVGYKNCKSLLLDERDYPSDGKARFDLATVQHSWFLRKNADWQYFAKTILGA